MYYIQRYKISCDQQNAYTIDLFNTSIPPNPLYAPLRGTPPSPLYPPLMAAKLLQYYVLKKTRHERSKLIVKNGESSNIIL